MADKPIPIYLKYKITMQRAGRAKMDIEDFVSWDIDHLKVDGCGQVPHTYALPTQFLEKPNASRMAVRQH